MTAVDVIMGWGSGDNPERVASRGWVLAWWRSRGFTVRTRESDVDPWVKAEAFNPPAAESSADVLIIADADSFVPLAQVQAAVASALRVGWAAPASHVYRLSREASAATLAADPAAADVAPDLSLDPGRPVHDLMPGGGIVVVRRDVWELVGGFDPRFIGWGGEDWALGAAIRTLTGSYATQVPGPYFHLWHPLVACPDALEASINELVLRYRQAKFRPDTMRALIAEREAVCR
jgi:hypothetical protein